MNPTQTQQNTPIVNGKTFAQASQGITDRNVLGSIARQFQQPINGAALGNTTVPTIPSPIQNNAPQNNLQTKVDTVFTGSQVQNKDGSTVTTFSDGTTNVPQTPDQQRQGFAQTLKDTFAKLGTKTARTNEIQQEEGVQAKQTELRNIETEAMALDKSFQRRIDNLLGSGSMTREQAAPQIQELQRMQNSQKADLAIRQRVAQGNYTDAFNIAQAKIEAEFAPYQAELDSLKTQIDLFQNDMTESEKVKANQAWQEKQDALDFQRQKQLISYRASIDAASGGTLNGTLTGKPQTAAQSTAQTYANRLAEANITLDALGGKFTGAGSAISNALGGFVPNFLKGGDRQAVEQAQKNFVTAILRRESGAAITDSEFKTAAQIYFPRPGDKADTIAQKAITRNTAINNFYREANVARPVLPGQIIESGGNRYKVGPDGQSLTQI